MDVSPRGDPAGFVQVMNSKTLLIPDRPGNQRGDTLSNILQNPTIGLLFLMPGRTNTLRVNGTAQHTACPVTQPITRHPALGGIVGSVLN